MDETRSTVLYEKSGGIGLVTLNRPERMNAISVAMWRALDEIWTSVDADPEVSVLVLTGAGERAFCVGMDLKEQAELSARGEDMLRVVPDPRMEHMLSVRKPIVAAINGIATAGGFLLAQNADLRVASRAATFSIREAKVGRGSPWAVPLVWMMPLGVALELTLTGEPIDAQRAYEVGFVNRLTDPQDLLPTALALAKEIASNAPLSVLAAKQALREAMSLGLERGLARADEIYAPVYASEDAVEGPRAFAEKRQPIWKGR